MVPVHHYDKRYVEVFTIMKIPTFKHELHFFLVGGRIGLGGGGGGEEEERCIVGGKGRGGEGGGLFLVLYGIHVHVCKDTGFTFNL